MADTTSIWSRKNPFPARLLANRRLTGPYSAKDTRHYELSLEGSGLKYEVGDALGIFGSNCLNLVQEIICALHCTGDEMVPGASGEPKTLREALWKDYSITHAPKPFLAALAEKAGEAASFLHALLNPERQVALDHYLEGVEIIDLLVEHPSVHFEPGEFVKHLRKLLPRLYSISSSLMAYPEQVHLTVSTVRYESHGRLRKGVCSTFLAERVPVGGAVPIFFHVAKGFRLPEDPVTPIIMVGPGTGIAPFRAFLQQRKASGATGKNWLFFGAQRSSDDFLYLEEFEQHLAEGILTRLDTAFSRDRDEKVYVQHRMLENAAQIWKWIEEEGAHFFVCGDATRMAQNVDAALDHIIQTEGNKTPEQAAEYIEALEKAKRYKRDVY
ncbi:MAG: sulfite reductase subunit alpha [Verrucomicrobiota bacterium]